MFTLIYNHHSPFLISFFAIIFLSTKWLCIVFFRFKDWSWACHLIFQFRVCKIRYWSSFNISLTYLLFLLKILFNNEFILKVLNISWNLIHSQCLFSNNMMLLNNWLFIEKLRIFIRLIFPDFHILAPLLLI
jgi:hypothetical protein